MTKEPATQENTEMDARRDVVENPVTGDRIIFSKRAVDTDGELVLGELHAAPQSPGLPEHIHPTQDEHWEVLSGELSIKLDREVRTLSEGEEVTFPQGSPHMVWNESDREARARVEFRPGFRVELLIETFFGLAQDGKTDDQGMPNLLQTAVILHEFRDEFYLTELPIFIQRPLFAALAQIGRLLGYKPYYREYSDPFWFE